MTSGRLGPSLLRARWVAGAALLGVMASLALSEALGGGGARTVKSVAAGNDPPAAAQSVRPPAAKAVAPLASSRRVPAAQPVRPPDDLPDNIPGRRLRAYLDAAGAGGNDADRRAQQALEELRAAGNEATQLVTETYRALPEQRYLARWMMIDTLSALGDHAALEQLQEVAEKAVPEERFPNDGEGHGQASSKEEELMIRGAAIRGIADLAQLGNRDAEQALRDIAANTDEGVRQKAALAYVELGVDHRARKAEMMDLLPPSEHWMARVPVIPAEHLPPLAPPARPESAPPALQAKAGDEPTTPVAQREGP